MAKKAGKKCKNKNQAVIHEQNKKLQQLWDLFQDTTKQYEVGINTLCLHTCAKIRKIYDDKLKALPENIRNMTLEEYIKMQKKNEQKSNQIDCDSINSELTKLKLLSEKKSQKKLNRTERKRSCSVSTCSSRKGVPPNVLSRASRVLSESCLTTPYNKRSVAPSCVITPKFNPNAPLSKACMRKPRAGEIVLSISGSPLLNFVDDVAVSLGGGKIIKLTEDTDIAKLENDFSKKLDAETKTTLEEVKKKLDKILQA